jgi:hypothetical protein
MKEAAKCIAVVIKNIFKKHIREPGMVGHTCNPL